METVLQRLGSLKAKSLQHIAFLTGLPSVGVKSRLVNDLATRLPQPRLPPGGRRVLSVDMGIRNLAFCVFDIPDGQILSKDIEAPLEIIQVKAWKRLDILEQLGSSPPIIARPNDEITSKRARRSPTLPSNAFTPSELSKTAFSITRGLLSFEPSVILIERQRHRSMGSSAVLEWIVRVNMLESMIWACLETQKMLDVEGGGSIFPSCFEVNPKKVANFWTAGSDGSLSYSGDDLEDHIAQSQDARKPRLGRKIEKKEKVDVVRAWLRGESRISLEFTSETQRIADAFTIPSSGRSRNSSDENVDAYETKLDDLSDCLLQGMALVRWEENRQAIWQSLKSDITEDTSLDGE